MYNELHKNIIIYLILFQSERDAAIREAVVKNGSFMVNSVADIKPCVIVL